MDHARRQKNEVFYHPRLEECVDQKLEFSYESIIWEVTCQTVLMEIFYHLNYFFCVGVVTKLLCFCTIQVIKIAPVPYGVNQHKSLFGSG